MRALHPCPARIGAELHQPLHRNKRGDRQEQAHQRQHHHPAAKAKRGSGGRGEERGNHQQNRRTDAEALRQDRGKQVHVDKIQAAEIF